jgi:tRNA A-37 threonylcarbamoyl transferase component Bud32
MDSKIDLPGYEILEKIGQGGMATVWAARQLSLDRTVAIKILSPQLVLDPDVLRRFRQEAQATAKLKHPGIVQVYDAGEHKGLVYLVLEYVAGCTVAELLDRKGRLAEKQALLVAEGVALSLGYAWTEAGIIHCDVKPANVIIDNDGAVKLSDLGLARSIGRHAVANDAQFFEGTPNYASPEQGRGDAELDCRTDIYSLGAMLYHITTGRLPFGRLRDDEIVQKHLFEFLPDPLDIQADISIGMASLIEKMMVKDRALRYPGWEAVQADIAEVEKGGLPPGEMPLLGQSTVLRSEARTRIAARPSVPSPAQRQSPGIRIKAPAKQAIVLPEEFRKQVHGRDDRSGELRRAIYSFVLMLVAVLGAYGALAFFWSSSRTPHVRGEKDGWAQMLPPRSQVARTATREAGTGSSTAVRVSSGAAGVRVPATPGPTTTVHWQDPLFIRGANLFNEALASYKQYLADKQNPDALATIEEQSRAAIKAFEVCRPHAPPEVKISELIDQAYRLISDCRQLALPDSSRPVPRKEPATVSGPTPLAMAAPARDTKYTDPLVLSPTWNSFMRGGTQILDDLRDLLTGHGQAEVDLKPDPGLILFGQISYLMPATEAARAINQSLSPRRGLSCPGFPQDSLFYHAMEGAFGDQFNELLLITDSTDRIVAVQLVNDQPDESLWLDPVCFDEKWHAYNFVQSRTKSSAKWRVGHRVEKAGQVLRVDSELVDNDEFGYFGLGDSKERVQLYLPQSLVNLILYRIEKTKKP